MPLRIWVIGTRTSSAPAGNSIDVPAAAARDAAGPGEAGARAGTPPDAGAGVAGAAAGAGAAAFAADWPLTGCPVRCDSTKFVTSSRVIRPPPPVPTIIAALRPCSRRSRRTAGVIRASALPGPPPAASRGPRSSDPAGPLVEAATGEAEDIADEAGAFARAGAPEARPAAP